MMHINYNAIKAYLSIIKIPTVQKLNNFFSPFFFASRACRNLIALGKQWEDSAFPLKEIAYTWSTALSVKCNVADDLRDEFSLSALEAPEAEQHVFSCVNVVWEANERDAWKSRFMETTGNATSIYDDVI